MTPVVETFSSKGHGQRHLSLQWAPPSLCWSSISYFSTFSLLPKLPTNEVVLFLDSHLLLLLFSVSSKTRKFLHKIQCPFKILFSNIGIPDSVFANRVGWKWAASRTMYNTLLASMAKMLKVFLYKTCSSVLSSFWFLLVSWSSQVNDDADGGGIVMQE